MARSFIGCAALLATLFATQVNAHGYVTSITANGKTYNAPKPTDEGGATESSSPVRLSSSEQPVILNAAGGINQPILACKNPTNSPAGALATIAAGSDLSIQWVNGAGSVLWPHNTGPILTYMAPCSDSKCDDDPTTLSFFKIAEDGQVAGSTSTWVQAELKEGNPYNVTIPSTLANGNYIMRHEIINLAPGPGLDESYPSCFQLSVTGGSGSSTPAALATSLTTVKFPGGYAAKDAGLNFDAYSGSSYASAFPGPAIPKSFAAGGGGGGGGNGTTPSISASVVPTTSSAPATTSPAVNKGTTTSASSAVPTTSPTGSPRVYVTTITEIFVMTMTLDDNNNNNNNNVKPTTTSSRVPSTTTTSSSQPTTTSDPEDPEDDGDCEEEEEEGEETITTTVAPSTTTASVVPTPTASGIKRRHTSARVRRSERWRPSAGGRS